MITTTPFEDNLLALIAPAATELGYSIVRIRMMGAKTQTLQVMAEKADGTMTSGDCERLSRAIGPILDANDPIAGEFNLEISSPGIDRPLTRLEDFEKWDGYKAKLELNRIVEGKRRYSGILAGIDGDDVGIDIDGEEETAYVPFAWLQNAKLVLTDELIRDTLNARKKDDEIAKIEEALDGGDLEIEYTSNEDEEGETKWQ